MPPSHIIANTKTYIFEIKQELSQEYRQKGNESMKQMKTEEALTFYDKSIEYDPLDHRGYSNRIPAYIQVGRYKEGEHISIQQRCQTFSRKQIFYKNKKSVFLSVFLCQINSQYTYIYIHTYIHTQCTHMHITFFSHK